MYIYFGSKLHQVTITETIPKKVKSFIHYSALLMSNILYVTHHNSINASSLHLLWSNDHIPYISEYVWYLGLVCGKRTLHFRWSVTVLDFVVNVFVGHFFQVQRTMRNLYQEPSKDFFRALIHIMSKTWWYTCVCCMSLHWDKQPLIFIILKQFSHLKMTLWTFLFISENKHLSRKFCM